MFTFKISLTLSTQVSGVYHTTEYNHITVPTHLIYESFESPKKAQKKAMTNEYSQVIASI